MPTRQGGPQRVPAARDLHAPRRRGQCVGVRVARRLASQASSQRRNPRLESDNLCFRTLHLAGSGDHATCSVLAFDQWRSACDGEELAKRRQLLRCQQLESVVMFDLYGRRAVRSGVQCLVAIGRWIELRCHPPALLNAKPSATDRSVIRLAINRYIAAGIVGNLERVIGEMMRSRFTRELESLAEFCVLFTPRVDGGKLGKACVMFEV